MKKLGLLLSIIIFSFVGYSQQTYIKNFDYHFCKDVDLFNMTNKGNSYYSSSIKNRGKLQILEVLQWTWIGDPGTIVSLIYFDISEIPENSKILKATLELHESKTQWSERVIQSRESREFRICKVAEPWKADKVIWKNKPSYTTNGAVIVGDNDNLQNIDVTQMVQEWVNKPNKNYGMYLETTKSGYYIGVVLASSECEDTLLRPSLNVIFQTNKNIKAAKEIESQTIQETHQSNNCNNNQTLIITNSNLDEVIKITNFSTDKLAEIISKLDDGTYLVQLIDENQNIVRFKLEK